MWHGGTDAVPALQTLFDKEWAYNPDTSNVYELINFKHHIV